MGLAMPWRSVVVTLAVLAAILPTPRPVVESVYSQRAFPFIQSALTSLSNLISLPFLDVALLATGAWLVLAVWREIRRAAGWLAAIGRVAARLATVAAIAYLAFLLAWGLNYRRVPLADRLQFDAGRISRAAAAQLARDAVARVNALHAVAHQEGWPDIGRVDPRLAAAFARARQELALRAGTRPARPKRTSLDPYLRRAGVAGMTDPYFLETFIATDLLPFERPAVIAHEWSHLAGVADEGDANFVAWITCLRGTPAHQYSGWLSLYGDVAVALGPVALRDVSATLAEGPRADLRAVRQRVERQVNPIVAAAGWRVYDRYLKANQVEEGTASYAQVVQLILGTRFGDGWTPVLRE
jgi:hypothetical protein